MPKISTVRITVKGRVQGIGFRPFIYRLARKLGLKGYVKNTKTGVVIECQGNKTKELLKIIKTSPPPLAKITEISITKIKKSPFSQFSIEKSEDRNIKNEPVEIIPDLAVCKDCCRDFTSKSNRRYFYPFTNCTQCGPRYSIIYELPYDRPNTTMNEFIMCQKCLKEYEDPKNRRFHAQPNACSECGPKLSLYNRNGKLVMANNNQAIIEKVKKLLKAGKIVAIKSMGGFQLACDAENDRAVLRLRKRKSRPSKPLALMVKDLKTARKLVYLSPHDAETLKSHIAPIVLLPKKPRAAISRYIAPNNNYLGIMLPYTPLHKLLFYRNVSRETFSWCPEVLVMTSANPKGEPIVLTKEGVIKKLGHVVDFILDHNRKISSRCDDSIVFWPNFPKKPKSWPSPIIIRYSRGFVPQPIHLSNIKLRPVVGFGSDLKNYFALGANNKIYLSPYIGDLINSANIEFFFEMLEKYIKWTGIKPETVACDLHPDYISSRLAEAYAKRNKLKLVKIQHHFAHLASVYAEHNLNGLALGLAFDGTGYGEDGAIWGSEVMVFNLSGYERIAHLKYMPLAGGDVSVTNPKLILDAYLGNNKNEFPVSSIQTSSMGRLFDAVAALLGVCRRQTFEGEAPIALESLVLKVYEEKTLRMMQFDGLDNDLDPVKVLGAIQKLKRCRYSLSEIAWWFHKLIITWAIFVIKKVSQKYQTAPICISGGVFQNRIIFSGIADELRKLNLKVYTNHLTPINDGNIAFGQAVTAGLVEK